MRRARRALLAFVVLAGLVGGLGIGLAGNAIYLLLARDTEYGAELIERAGWPGFDV